MARVVVLGGGFGSVVASESLARRLGPKHEVTLVSLGPKMEHLPVLHGEVAAANVAAEIEGREPAAEYDYELMLVNDEGGKDSIYLHKKLWEGGEPDVRQGRFWGWAKRSHAGYWPRLHALERVEPAEE